jgi:hypothetical protein
VQAYHYFASNQKIMDLDAFFERIDLQYSQLLPFVVYRKPDTNEVMALLQKDGALYTTTDYSETGFVFAPFDDKDAAVLIPLEHSERFSIIPAFGSTTPTDRAGTELKKEELSFDGQHTTKAFQFGPTRN